MSAWNDLPFSAKLFQNVKEAVLTKAGAAAENCFVNEAGGFSRFPGLKAFATLSGSNPTYLHQWQGNLIGVTSGLTYRVNHAGVAENVTDVPVAGGMRVIFDRTDNELIMAAGGPIVRLGAAKTEILSPDAPLSTHVGYIDGYAVALEKGSGRFMHSDANEFRTWDPLSVFAATGKPDDLNALLVTGFRELILTGLESIEQFERLTTGTAPFFRRWAVGEGVVAPYTLLEADNGSWYVNKRYEFSRASGQVSRSSSDDIGRTLEGVSDWTDAWAAEMLIGGQKFIVLQIPNETNVYGTKGVTALLDYRQQRWYSLFGWDLARAEPVRWPGWSYYPLWGRHFVGGEGRIYELDLDTFQNAGVEQRVLSRTGHYDLGPMSIDNVRMRLKRGVGSGATAPEIWLRCIRDNKAVTRWKKKSLGLAGDTSMHVEFGPMGCIDGTAQFEWFTTANCELEVVKMQYQGRRIGF